MSLGLNQPPKEANGSQAEAEEELGPTEGKTLFLENPSDPGAPREQHLCCLYPRLEEMKCAFADPQSRLTGI